MESSAKPAEPDRLNTRLLQVLALSDYEELVDRIAAGLFRRAMEERVTFSRPENAHRFRDRPWGEVDDKMRRGWRAEARAILEDRLDAYVNREEE